MRQPYQLGQGMVYLNGVAIGEATSLRIEPSDNPPQIDTHYVSYGDIVSGPLVPLPEPALLAVSASISTLRNPSLEAATEPQAGHPLEVSPDTAAEITAAVMPAARRTFPPTSVKVKMLPEPERPIADSRLHRLVKTKRNP